VQGEIPKNVPVSSAGAGLGAWPSFSDSYRLLLKSGILEGGKVAGRDVPGEARRPLGAVSGVPGSHAPPQVNSHNAPHKTAFMTMLPHVTNTRSTLALTPPGCESGAFGEVQRLIYFIVLKVKGKQWWQGRRSVQSKCSPSNGGSCKPARTKELGTQDPDGLCCS
jgi:hypothetical protein